MVGSVYCSPRRVIIILERNSLTYDTSIFRSGSSSLSHATMSNAKMNYSNRHLLLADTAILQEKEKERVRHNFTKAQRNNFEKITFSNC